MNIVKSNRSQAVIIFTLALILRLSVFFLMPVPEAAESDGEWCDVINYNIIAYNISAGNGFAFSVNEPTAWHPSLLPLSLALVYSFFGYSYIFGVVFVIIIGSCIPALIYLVTARLFNQQSALIAGAISLVYPPLIYYSGITTTETLFTFMLLIMVLFLIRGVKSHQLNIAFAGVLFGLTVLCRSNALPLLGFVPIWLFLNQWSGKARAIKGTVLFLLLFIVVYSPWLYRNYSLFNDFPILQTNGGATLYYFGHNDLAKEEKENKIMEKDNRHIAYGKEISEIRATMKRGDFIPKERLSMSRQEMWVADELAGSNNQGIVESLNERVLDKFFYRKSLEYMRDNPKKMIIQSAKNVAKFFWIFKARNKNYDNREINFPYLFIFLFGIAGFYFSRYRWKLLTIFYAICFIIFMVSVVFVHAERFRLPVEAIMIIFTGYAVYNLSGLLRKDKEESP